MLYRIGLSVALVLIPCVVTAASSGNWVVDSHSSSTVSFENEECIIQGFNNLHAHIEQDLTTSSLLRVSSSIKAPDASELYPAVFLYWTPDNWARIGYIAAHDIYHVNGPGIYGTVCENGKETRYRLTTTNSEDWTYVPETGNLQPASTDSRWRDVALLTSEDEIFFQLRGNSNHWETVQKVPRSAALKSAPEKVIIGKGYYAAGTHTAPDLDNDLSDPGAETTAVLKNIRLEAVSPGTLDQAIARGEHYLDVYGQAELDKPGDPTYESVSAYWPALQYTRDALSVPDHRDEFVVLPDGQIGMWPSLETLPTPGNGSKAWFTVGPDKLRFGGGTTVTRVLQDNWLPILTCDYRKGAIQYTQTVAGWSADMSPDNPLFAIIRMQARNESASTETTELCLYGENEKEDLLRWNDIVLAPSETKTFYCKLKFPTEGKRLETWTSTSDEFENKLNEIKARWTEIVSQGTQFDIPEQRIMNAHKAWLVWAHTGVDKIKGNYEFHDGAGGFYELVYGISATRASQIFDKLNRTDDSRKWLDAMLTMVDKDGLFLVNSGLPDQGALMQSVWHHYLYTKDKAWLKKATPTLLRMCEWSLANRKKSKAEIPSTSPVHGSIKARPYCDHAQPEHFIMSDVYLAKGLLCAADALQETGLTTESERVRQEAISYSRDIQRILQQSVFEVDGHKLLPMFPETRELLRASGWMSSNYYSLLSPYLLADCDPVFDPDSAYAEMIVKALEQRGGLLMGLCRFWGGIDHAYTAGYWQHRLQRDEPEKALLGLYASLAYGMSRDTFSSVEVTFAKDGKNFPTLPHNYSNQEQLRLLRNLLVLESSGTLLLGAGIARHWLATGKAVGVTNAGTEWGNLSYTMKMHPDGKITTDLQTPSTTPPDGIKVFVRHPDSLPIKAVNVSGATVKEQDDQSILLLPTSPRITISTAY